MKRSIPYSRQWIDSDDINEVLKVLRTDWISQGPKIREFEDSLCRYTGAKYAVCVSSGTAALHLSMLALGLQKGDRVVTSPITFCASANCALYADAEPSFVDIDDMTYHLSIEKLQDFLKSPSRRKNIKVVIPVHLMGTVADVARIKKLCDKYGIKIVEDAAHALGAKYRLNSKSGWINVGSCRHSDITIFSFHPIKHITTGEGGVVLTNDKRIYQKILRLRHHGIVKNNRSVSKDMRRFNNQYWFYDLPQLGFNYRITDFQCALGLSQLRKLDRWVKVRRRLVKTYNDSLSTIKEIRLPYEREGTYASYHLYVIRVPEDRRNALYNYLKENGIFTQVNYIPVHLFSYYMKELGYRWGDFPAAETYFKECLSLPLYVRLSNTEQSKVIKSTKNFFER